MTSTYEFGVGHNLSCNSQQDQQNSLHVEEMSVVSKKCFPPKGDLKR